MRTVTGIPGSFLKMGIEVFDNYVCDGQMELPLDDSGMDYQMNLFKGAPDDEAIKMIQYYEGLALENDPRGYCVCTSEGKDSRVLGHLFRRAGVKHFYLHSITGIDPPELIYFQRKNFQEYKDLGYPTYDIMYAMSIWKLMRKKKIPPLRRVRYCCQELKEKKVPEQANAILSFGVRKHESKSRSLSRDELEIVANGRSGKNIIMPYDNDKNRRTFEICYADCEKRLNPIAEWYNEDIWNYSQYWKLEQSGLYDEGFTRLGCIGCPMAKKASRKMEFDRWPKYKDQYIRTFAKMIEDRKKENLVIYDYAATAEDWFNWWVSDRPAGDKDEAQMELELL